MKSYDFIIAGAGIFGIATAVELAKRKYRVAILNPGTIPHPLAASTDISKAVRMEYGSDLEYMDMVIESIQGWKNWNELFKTKLYHETGYMLITSKPLENSGSNYAQSSFENLIKKGFNPERLDQAAISKKFPTFNSNYYCDGFYHEIGGYAESGKTVKTLSNYAKQLGVEIHEDQTVNQLNIRNNRIHGVETKESNQFHAGNVILCMGPYTPGLMPDLKPFMKATGHPVFHLKIRNPDLFIPPAFAVFGADISETGWYGFPLHPTENVLKIANHGEGLLLDPEYDERIVTKADMVHFRKFLKQSFPKIANDPIVYTRRCLYTDTLDGHFWIDCHPEIEGLTIGTGGSGHGFKMAPILGDMIAATAEGGDHKWSKRYKWRRLDEATIQKEEARYLSRRKL